MEKRLNGQSITVLNPVILRICSFSKALKSIVLIVENRYYGLPCKQRCGSARLFKISCYEILGYTMKNFLSITHEMENF